MINIIYTHDYSCGKVKIAIQDGSDIVYENVLTLEDVMKTEIATYVEATMRHLLHNVYATGERIMDKDDFRKLIELARYDNRIPIELIERIAETDNKLALIFNSRVNENFYLDERG